MNWLKSLEGLLDPDKPKVRASSQFESAQTYSRRRGTVPGGRPQDLRKDLTGGSRHQMLKTARYVGRNFGLSVEQRTMMATYAIGKGRMPQSLAVDVAWRDEAEALFNEKMSRPEITNRFTWRETQDLISNILDEDGELFGITTFDNFGNPKIQMLETHAFSNVTKPDELIFDGIKYDAFGRPRFYYLENQKGGDPIPVPAASVIHIFDPIRFSMSRCYPTGQHGLLHAQDELEMLASEKQAVKHLQQFSGVLTSDREKALEDGDFGLDSEAAEIAAGSLTTDEQEVAEAFGAIIQRLDKGEELKAFQFDRPNPMFTGFLELLERDYSGGRLPWEVTRDPSKIGGASVRLVVSKADRIIQKRGEVIDTRFNNRVWFYVIGDAIDKGELKPVKGWNKVTWTSPRRLTVDAGREAQANRLDVETGLKTWAEEISERGGDFDEWLTERTEQARRILTASGHPASEPIPLWMIYKPSGVSLTSQSPEDMTL